MIRGHNPKSTLFGTLNRDPTVFKNLGRNQWVLVAEEGDDRSDIGGEPKGQDVPDDVGPA